MQHNKKLTPRAQVLRKNMTKEERKLWHEYLRGSPRQFRRQVPAGCCILDVYCASAKLAVELDGSGHYEPEGRQYDMRRDGSLRERGIQVLRISNLDVLRNFVGVCQLIDKTVQERGG